MGHNLIGHSQMSSSGPLKVHKRASRDVITKFENLINKLSFALDEYSLSGLAGSDVEATLRQAEYIILSIKHDLNFMH